MSTSKISHKSCLRKTSKRISDKKMYCMLKFYFEIEIFNQYKVSVLVGVPFNGFARFGMF